MSIGQKMTRTQDEKIRAERSWCPMPRMIINANDNVVELTHSMMIGRKEQSSEEKDDDANVVELTHSMKL